MLNERVEAWKGPHKGKCGIVTRVDGIPHCYVRFDGEGWEENVSRSDLICVKFLKEPNREQRPEGTSAQEAAGQ